MSVTPYGTQLMPKIVNTADGKPKSSRGTIKLPGKSSQAYYLGQFVSLIVGSDGTPAGSQYYASPYTGSKELSGIVVGFTRFNSLLPIFDDSGKGGTVTNPTNSSGGTLLPAKYTFPAGNDESSGTSATLELLEIMPIFNDDILEMYLWDTVGVKTVTRGTTTAYGSSGSSANIGVGLALDTTYPFVLDESTAAVNLATLDFMTTELVGQKPVNPYTVYVRPLRAYGTFRTALA